MNCSRMKGIMEKKISRFAPFLPAIKYNTSGQLLQVNLYAKIVIVFWSLTIFVEKLFHRCLTAFLIRLRRMLH